MILLLKYLLCGVVFMVIFELIKDKSSPQVQLTNYDRLWGVAIWPLMTLTFIGAIIYYFIKMRRGK